MTFELAQMNVGRLRAPLDSPATAEFVAALDAVNALAEQADGFIWRLQSSDGNATAFRPLSDDVLINLSVWRDVESLRAFVYRSAHTDFLRRRGEWFEAMREAHSVLWWVPTGDRPGETDGIERLRTLAVHGPTPRAFTFGRQFAPA